MIHLKTKPFKRFRYYSWLLHRAKAAVFPIQEAQSADFSFCIKRLNSAQFTL
jgi:hypothetical protein